VVIKGRRKGGRVLGLYVRILILEGVEFRLSGLWWFIVDRGFSHVKRRLTVVISLKWQNMLALSPSETHVEFHVALPGARKCLSVAFSKFICITGGMRRFALCAKKIQCIKEGLHLQPYREYSLM